MKIFHYKIINGHGILGTSTILSILEYRIILLALSQINIEDDYTQGYRVKIHDILGKNNTSNYYIIHNVVKKLCNSLLEIQKDTEWRGYTFITNIQSDACNKYLEIQFYNGIRRFLLNFKEKYTPYTLNNVIFFRKTASFRIYELCKPYEKIGFLEIFMDDLRILFSLEVKYKIYSNFRENVLNAGIQEMNRYSDIFVKFKEIKIGRKIDKIQFFIQKNPLSDQIISNKKNITCDNCQSSVEEKLLNIGFLSLEIIELKEKYQWEYIVKTFDLYTFQSEKIKSPKAWIRKVLENQEIQRVKEKNSRDVNLHKNAIIDPFIQEEYQKRLIYLQKIFEIKNLKENISRDKEDKKKYEATGRLNPGDIMRFKDMSMKEVLEKLNERIAKNQNLLKNFYTANDV